MKQWKVVNTSFYKDSRMLVLDSFGNMPFNYLKELILENNSITSIEKLNTVIIPNLRVLSLSYNRLSSIKPLQKSSFPKIFYLELNSNPIKEIQNVVIAEFPKLETLQLDICSSCEQTSSLNIQSLFKIKSRLLSNLEFQQGCFYKSKSMKQVFLQKWVNFDEDYCDVQF